MNDPSWCNVRLDALEEELETMGHGHRIFSEIIGELRLTWNDSASKEIFSCYLEPFQTEIGDCKKKLLSQLFNLRDVVTRMKDAEAPVSKIQQFSEDASRIRQDIENEIQTAHHRIDRSLDEIARSDEFTIQSIAVLESI